MGRSRLAAAALGAAVLLGVMPLVGPAGAVPRSESAGPESVPEAGPLAAPVRGADEGSVAAEAVSASDGAPVLGAGFVLSAERVSAGLARLGWDDVAAADGYEVMALSRGRWLLLSPGDAVGGVSVHFDGSSAVVAGLAEPVPGEGWWFAVRARNAFGLSGWSAGVQAAVRAGSAPLFDPFTAPTRSGIDLERLREATATIDTTSDCGAAPALDVAGVKVVAAM